MQAPRGGGLHLARHQGSGSRFDSWLRYMVIEHLPNHGRVVLAHPTRLPEAMELARREGGLDVKLTDLVDVGHCYVIDLDAIFTLPDPSEWLL